MKNIIKILDHYLQITKYRAWLLLPPTIIWILITLYLSILSLIFKFKIQQYVVAIFIFVTIYLLFTVTVVFISDLRKINKDNYELK